MITEHLLIGAAGMIAAVIIQKGYEGARHIYRNRKGRNFRMMSIEERLSTNEMEIYELNQQLKKQWKQRKEHSKHD